jgi:abhydrolase domain-containing protein 13
LIDQIQALLDYIEAHETLSKTRIFLYGQSIGGAVAIDLASRNPDKIYALILENTFTALVRLMSVLMSTLITYLISQK